MEQNVKGAVWTVDDSEFYKRRPQRSSSSRSAPKPAATLRSVASTSQFPVHSTTTADLFGTTGGTGSHSMAHSFAQKHELASSASTPAQLHTLREEFESTSSNFEVEPLGGGGPLMLSLGGAPLSVSMAPASPVSAVDFPMREEDEEEEDRLVIAQQGPYSAPESEVDVVDGDGEEEEEEVHKEAQEEGQVMEVEGPEHEEQQAAQLIGDGDSNNNGSENPLRLLSSAAAAEHEQRKNTIM